MFRSVLTLCLAILGSASALAGPKPTVALAPTTSARDSAEIDVGSRLETELIATDSFRVLESRNIKDILTEQGFQQSGACDTTDCAVQIGQLLSVERIVQARLRRTEGHWEFSARLLDVGTGQILVSHILEIHGNPETVLQGGCREMAAILASRKQPKSSRTALEAKRPLWPWLTAGGILLAGGGAGIWYFSQKDNPAPAPTSYQVQLDWSSAP